MKKNPEAGELVCLSSNDKFAYPHGVALYLDDGKVVLPSYLKGWVVTDIDGLENYSTFGRHNIRKTHFNEYGEICGYDYLAYDAGIPTELCLRRTNGEWIISNEFKLPTWVQ